MNRRVKIGILGCADIAKRYAINAFQAIDNSKVVSIASRDEDKAKEWASAFNIKAEASYDALLRNRDIDAVYIPLPVGLHKEWVVKAAASGKHIICEKSLAGDFESVKVMIEACRASGIILYENFMTGFHPQHQKITSIIKEGEIGEAFVFRGYFGFSSLKEDNIRYDKELGGGSLNDAGAHIVFMARKVFGKEPVSVACNLVDDPTFGVDVQGNAMLQFPDRQTALIAFSYSSAYQNNYSVWGSKAVITTHRAYSIAPGTEPVVELTKIENYRELTRRIEVPAADQFRMIFYDFCDTVLNKNERADKIRGIYSQLVAQGRVMQALRISSKENRSIGLHEIV